MKLLTLATLLTSVISSDNEVFTVGGPWPMFLDYDECINTHGMATGVSTKNRDKIVFYRNRDCGRGPYAWGVGDYRFRSPYTFASFKMSKGMPILYGKSNDVGGAPQDSDNGKDGGESEGDPSFYRNPNYYHNWRPTN